MRDELLADRSTASEICTTPLTQESVTHRPPIAVSRFAPIMSGRPRAMSIAMSMMHNLPATYQRLRQLPLRTKFLIVLCAYMALTAAVVFGSPLDIIDRVAAASDLAHRFPHAAPWVLRYVMLGQRGPSSHVAFAYLVYRAIRQRSWRPLVLFVTALTMLNVTVGSVKLATGRLGPALTTHPRAVFDGGDIFPSGHTSNAVVIFGVLAMVAFEHRRAWIALAFFVCTTVGLSTIFLDTHWVTDVLGGWLAGALVLLALPTTYALLEKWVLRMTRAAKEWLRPRPAIWEQPAHDMTSELLTEDAMSR